MIQRRVDDTVDFNRTWNEYENGFGSLHGNFWLGLWKMHDLTTEFNARLRVEMNSSMGETREKFAEYGKFSVGNSSEQYRAYVDSYDSKSTADDSLLSAQYISGMMFTTVDRDNDKETFSNCADFFSGGWWHNSCFDANLNGLYPSFIMNSADCTNWLSYARYMTWKSFNNCFADIIYSMMTLIV